MRYVLLALVFAFLVPKSSRAEPLSIIYYQCSVRIATKTNAKIGLLLHNFGAATKALDPTDDAGVACQAACPGPRIVLEAKQVVVGNPIYDVLGFIYPALGWQCPPI